jgi:hypothetical protein
MRFRKLVAATIAGIVAATTLVGAPAANAGYGNNTWNCSGGGDARNDLGTGQYDWNQSSMKLAFGPDNTTRGYEECRNLDEYGDVKLNYWSIAVLHVRAVKGKPKPTVVASAYISVRANAKATTADSSTGSLDIKGGVSFGTSHTYKLLDTGFKKVGVKFPKCQVTLLKGWWNVYCRVTTNPGDVIYHWPANRDAGGLQAVDYGSIMTAKYAGKTYTIRSDGAIANIGCPWVDRIDHRYGC